MSLYTYPPVSPYPYSFIFAEFFAETLLRYIPIKLYLLLRLFYMIVVVLLDPPAVGF